MIGENNTEIKEIKYHHKSHCVFVENETAYGSKWSSQSLKKRPDIVERDILAIAVRILLKLTVQKGSTPTLQ